MTVASCVSCAPLELVSSPGLTRCPPCPRQGRMSTLLGPSPPSSARKRGLRNVSSRGTSPRPTRKTTPGRTTRRSWLSQSLGLIVLARDFTDSLTPPRLSTQPSRRLAQPQRHLRPQPSSGELGVGSPNPYSLADLSPSIHHSTSSRRATRL